MESDIRFYRRRASEELAAADRAVTAEARDRRLQLANVFLGRLNELQLSRTFADCHVDVTSDGLPGAVRGSAFDWADEVAARRA